MIFLHRTYTNRNQLRNVLNANVSLPCGQVICSKHHGFIKCDFICTGLLKLCPMRIRVLPSCKEDKNLPLSENSIYI